MSDRFDIATIDFVLLIAYLILSRVIPLIFVKKNESSDDYFLGGRNFIWPLIGISLVATNMSGATYVGLAGGAYSQGISIFAYEWMAAIILVVFIFFILPFYLRSRVFTLPEFLEKRYDRRSRLTFSGFNLFANMFIDTAAALYAGGLVFQTLFPVVPLWVSITILAGLAAAYTITGGLSAVVITDFVQGLLVLVGGVAVFILALMEIPSWDAVRQATDGGQLSLIEPIGDPDLPWPGLLTGVLVIGLYYWTTNQLVVQRTLGARSLDHGRWGALLAGFIKLSFLFLFILPGVFALVLYPNLKNPDIAFPLLAFDMLPIGIRGIMLAAVVAAIMSTVDSILNSASTLITMDFVKTFRPDMSSANLMNIGRVATGGALIVAIVWAPQIAAFPSLYGYLQSVLSYTVPPIVATFLLGIMWYRITPTAAFVTLVSWVPLGVVMFVLNEILGVFGEPIQFLYVAGISLLVSLLTLVGISLLGAAPEREDLQDVTWRPELWREETEELRGQPLYANYRFWSVTLLISTFVIVFIFR